MQFMFPMRKQDKHNWRKKTLRFGLAAFGISVAFFIHNAELPERIAKEPDASVAVRTSVAP
ncbi:MAG: hypothetical protein ACE37D_18350, partial [Pseudomonadales bacterium]